MHVINDRMQNAALVRFKDVSGMHKILQTFIITYFGSAFQ